MSKRRFAFVCGKTAVATAVAIALAGCFGGSAQNSRVGAEIVEGGVIFRYYDTNASHVFLVGDFNGWAPRADSLADENGDGEWTLFINLAPGVYQYRLVVDDNWIADPRNPEKVSDGFGGENSIVRVPPR
jgi:1,4-alpha-glucan branching enzyme